MGAKYSGKSSSLFSAISSKKGTQHQGISSNLKMEDVGMFQRQTPADDLYFHPFSAFGMYYFGYSEPYTRFLHKKGQLLICQISNHLMIPQSLLKLHCLNFLQHQTIHKRLYAFLSFQFNFPLFFFFLKSLGEVHTQALSSLQNGSKGLSHWNQSEKDCTPQKR